MLPLAFLTGILLAASPSARPAATVWEMDVDRPSLQVNPTADAVRGMQSGRVCRLGKELFQRFGGKPRGNQCSLSFETGKGLAFFGYCDAQVSYLVQVNLERCQAQELAMFRDKRLTGTAVMDPGHSRIMFSHLGGTYAFNLGATEPVANFPGVVVYSNHEFFGDADRIYILNTTLTEPTLHRIELETLKETRVAFGTVTVLDYAGGRLLLRGATDPRAFGLYDVRTKRIVQRWRSPASARAHFVGEGWIAFWTRPKGKAPGDWILVNAASGESVYYGKWRGKKPPSVAWKGRVLYSGRKQLLAADQARPVVSPLRKWGAKRG